MKNKKSLGQNWLKDRGILDAIASSVEVSGVEICLEIGPGLGTLTSSLLRVFPRVVAVEFDAELARKLPGSFPGKNLEVINADILDFDLAQLPEKYVVAGNIPYYITSPIVRKFLTAEHKPEKIVLLMQKEVAERLAAGQGKASFSSVFAQNYAEVSLGPVVGREMFTPAPKVDSQVLILEPFAEPRVSQEAIEVAKVGFSSPRKKLAVVLAGQMGRLGSVSGRFGMKIKEGIGKEQIREMLVEMGLSADVRPADLSLENWQKLTEHLFGKTEVKERSLE